MGSVLIRFRTFFIWSCNLLLIALSLVGAFLLRFDFAIAPFYATLLKEGLILALLAKVAVFAYAGLNQGWWRYVGLHDLRRILLANLGGSALFSALAYGLIGRRFPLSIYILDFLLCFVATVGARLAIRFYNEAFTNEGPKQKRKGLLIYGAGSAGMILVREIRANPDLNYEIVGFIDDDPSKLNNVFLGIRVLGAGAQARQIVRQSKFQIKEIVVAMPSATGRQIRQALEHCRATGAQCKTIPGLGELMQEKVLTSQARPIALQDLLGRDPVRLGGEAIRQKFSGRVVLVTGGAGSIGSEICRQVAAFSPQRLVVFDQAESDLYRIEHELQNRFPKLDFSAEIGDIRNPLRIEELFEKHKIDSIFHAAAYKHVPLMERNILVAVRNNVLGTWNMAQAARRHKVSDFIMISSDKAVNPTSIMGTTKRVAELIVAAVEQNSRRDKNNGNGHPRGLCASPAPQCPCQSERDDCTWARFISVRFGNVLGSNGSVVPLFEKQIAQRGPVTVTHPDMQRYFMTIPEAVQLVLEASTMGKGAEIFVLDMGDPVKIVDLAINMIQLAGLRPHEDIEIVYTGLRPGEKLFEELKMDGEDMLPTHHEKIKIFQDRSGRLHNIPQWMKQTEMLLEQRDSGQMLEHLLALVPEYQGNHTLLRKKAAGAETAWAGARHNSPSI